MSLPKLPELDMHWNHQPNVNWYTEAQMLAFQAATVEAVIATLNASTYNMTKQECIDTIRAMLKQEKT
jgi:hypothetical protein